MKHPTATAIGPSILPVHFQLCLTLKYDISDRATINASVIITVNIQRGKKSQDLFLSTGTARVTAGHDNNVDHLGRIHHRLYKVFPTDI